MTDELVISARDLHFYRGATPILNGVDLELRTRDTVSIQGTSGSGKSTLLAVLCGLLTPSNGDVTVVGESMGSQPDRVRSRIRLRSIGLVFQGDEFLPEMTLLENVSLPLRLNRYRSQTRSYESEVVPLLDRLGIGDLASRFPAEVSGGQLQRAAVARSVIHRPAVVLADEPTGSLDDAASRDAMTLLLEVADETGSAVVVVTHDDEVAGLCATRLILTDGRLEPSTGRRALQMHHG